MEAVSHHSEQIEEVQPVSTKENMKIESARGKKSKDEQKTVSFVQSIARVSSKSRSRQLLISLGLDN